MFKKISRWFIAGLCLAFLVSFAYSMIPIQVNSWDAAYKTLENKILPKINLEKALIPDAMALNYHVDAIQESLPDINRYPLYGAQPSKDTNAVYVEIYTSAEKANALKKDERWLLDVAEKFNSQKVTTKSGKVIQVGIRNIPSGVAQRLIAAKKVQPTAYSPSHSLWLKMLDSEGIQVNTINDALLPSIAGFAVSDAFKQEIVGEGKLTFEQLLDAILAGKAKIGYTNPFTSSTGLNLLYTLFWQAAGHNRDGKPLTATDLESPQVISVFENFQQQVLTTAAITPDLKQIFLRDSNKLPAFSIDYLSFASLQQLPEFADMTYVPFGIAHNSPLAGFGWNSAEETEALNRFAEFAISPEMARLAPQQNQTVKDYLNSKQLPPLPDGDVLKAAQSFWKQNKDGGRTVYLEVVIDTSGSMEGEPLQAVKEGLRVASKEINSSNHVGLVSFSDFPNLNLPLAPFDTLQHQKFLAAIDSLDAYGSTAMYDGMMVGIKELMEQQSTNPNGRFYLLVLSDGATNKGHKFARVRNILAHSNIRFYPIAYGNLNRNQLENIAALKESTVKQGTPENVQSLLKSIFQINL